MILFKPEHVPLILAGTKTQTRRIIGSGWHQRHARWKVGSVHKCYTRPPFARGGSTPFASVLIKAVGKEKLEEIGVDDVRCEGYTSRREYFEAFFRINRLQSESMLLRVWVVDFKLVSDGEPKA